MPSRKHDREAERLVPCWGSRGFFRKRVEVWTRLFKEGCAKCTGSAYNMDPPKISSAAFVNTLLDVVEKVNVVYFSRS
jgi:hypothetical protein